MNEKKKGKFSIKPKYVLIILIVLFAVLLGATALEPELAKPVKEAAATVVLPLQKGMNRVGSILFERQEEKRTNEELAKENASLQAKVDELTRENNQLSLDNYELARLRELFSLSETYLDYDSVGARVIAKDTGNLFSLFTIDKGSADGIEVNMNVLSGGGLMGIVTETGEHYAKVRSIIDDSSNVSAMFISTSELCMVEGNISNYESGYLEISGIQKEAAAPLGDAIVTSNVSSLYLPGILIGYVTDMKDDENNLTKKGTVTLAGQFANVDEVLVILKLKDTGEE